MTNPLQVSLDVSAVPLQPAGAGRYIMELARGLGAGDAVRATYVARRDDDTRWESMGGVVRPVVPANRAARLLWEQVRLPGWLKRAGVQLHHAPHYTMPERAAVPVVVTIHDLTFFDNPEWHEKSKVIVFRRAIETAAKRASHLIAVSHDTARRIEERFGVTSVTVIPHGIDHSRFHAQPVPGERDQLTAAGVPPECIAFVGTIEPRKNLPRLIEAFDAIAGQNPSLHLVIAGQRGWALDQFDRALDRAEHKSRIIIPGYLAEPLIPALFRNARAVAYPSLAEGFGLPALEALACGAPVVTGSGTALEEVAGTAAIVVNQDDTTALADGIRQALAEDREVARKRGVEAARPFTWDAAVERHIEVYESVAAR